MPIYEYECTECSHADDEFQKMSSPPLTRCPKCQSETYRKLISCPSGAMEQGFFKPIEMYSIAMDNDDEIRDFKRRCTSNEIDVSTDQNDPMYGIPIARNRRQKLAALEASGFQERK
jgi:putative FmdB family regulatory protein